MKSRTINAIVQGPSSIVFKVARVFPGDREVLKPWVETMPTGSNRRRSPAGASGKRQSTSQFLHKPAGRCRVIPQSNKKDNKKTSIFLLFRSHQQHSLLCLLCAFSCHCDHQTAFWEVFRTGNPQVSPAPPAETDLNPWPGTPRRRDNRRSAGRSRRVIELGYLCDLLSPSDGGVGEATSKFRT